MGQHRDDDLGLVAVAFGEERADRPVDEPGDQRLALGRASFPLEIAARDFSRGVEFFLVIDGQGEEVDARLGLRLPDGGSKHHRLSIGRNNGPVGLTRDTSRFKNELPPAPIDLLAVNFEHAMFLPSFPTPDCVGPSFPQWSRIAY